MEIVAIVLSLFLLVTFAYRGFSVILFAPIFALFAASFSGLPILPGYTELFMAKAVTYIKSFFPVFPPRCRFRQGHGRNGHGPQYRYGNN